MAAYLIRSADFPFTILLKGRTEWALRQLMAAGTEGCTPIDHPEPRWSSYVFNLRRAGLNVETIHEAHHGPYPGHYARYVLQDLVEEMGAEDA